MENDLAQGGNRNDGDTFNGSATIRKGKGNMFQLISRKLKEVDPGAAADYLTHNEYEGQRKLKDRRVKQLVDLIESKRFTVGYIVLARQGWNGGDKLLANGQHQCAAVIATSKPIVAVVEEYECRTAEDFADLYRQFDNTPQRSLAEVALPEARALNLQWSQKFIGIMLSGISFIEHHAGVHKNKRVEFLKKYIREGDFIHEILSPFSFPEYRHMSRGSVIAAMINTFRKCATDAEDFWEKVLDGENLPGSSPALKLRNYLLSSSVSVGRGVSNPSLNAAVSIQEMYGKCIVAWNAYRRKDTTQLKFYANKEIPKPV